MENISEFSIEYFFGKKPYKEQNFLIIEDIDAKGELILLKLIQEYLSDNFRTILVLLEVVPNSLLEELVVKESENFAIVNTYSDSHSRYYTSIQLHELSLTLKALRKQLKSDKKLVIVFWSLNPLFIYYSSNDVIRFYLENVKHAVENNSIEFYLIGKGLVEDLVMRRLMAIAHCVLQLDKNQSSENVYDITYLKTMGLNINRKIIKYKYELVSPIWESNVWFIDHL